MPEQVLDRPLLRPTQKDFERSRETVRRIVKEAAARRRFDFTRRHRQPDDNHLCEAEISDQR
jgi:hypothetical protein